MKQEISQLKVGIVLNYVNMIVGNLIPIFYTPVMLNLLGQQEYGLYKLSSSTASYLSLISMGISSAVVRYLIKAREEDGTDFERKILGLFMIIFQIIAFLTFIVGIILVFNLDKWYSDSLTVNELRRMKVLVFLMVCTMSISFCVTPYMSITTAHEKFIFIQIMNILTTCIGPIVNIVVLWLGFASVGMAMSSLVINIVIQLLYLMYVHRKLKIKASYSNLPFGFLKEILSFSFWVFVANTATQLYNATDIVMIGAIPNLATEGTAIYSVGIVFVNIILNLSVGLSSVLVPKTNKMVFNGTDEKELTDFSIRIGRIQAYIVSLVGTGFIVFGQPFIYFYAGKSYLLAYWVAIFIMIPNMIPPLQSIYLNIIMALNKHKFRSFVYLGIAVLNVVGTWFLLTKIGLLGASLMSGIALFIGSGIVMNWYYWKKMKFNIPRFWKEVGKIFTIPILMCILFIVLFKFINLYNIKVMCISIIIYTIIFFALNWFFIMNNYEKELVLGFLKKLSVLNNEGKRR